MRCHNCGMDPDEQEVDPDYSGKQLHPKIAPLKMKLKKSAGQINKFAMMSSRGKCTNEDWIKALDEYSELMDEYVMLLCDVKSVCEIEAEGKPKAR